MRRLFTAFPLLLLPVLLYALLTIIAGKPDATSAAPMFALLGTTIFELPMISGGAWKFRLADAVLVFALIMLFIEIVKSTNTEAASLMNHGLSIGALIVSIILFLSLRNFATSEFFLLLVMLLLDVVAGFMVTVVAARRDFGVESGLMD